LGEIIKDWDGRHYDKFSCHQKEWGNALIQELKIKGNERILDLGCGNGHTTRRLAALVPLGEVIGIDASAKMLEVAREKCSPNMKVKLLEINDLDYEDEFDIIFSSATLHWIIDHKRLLLNICRALKPSGYMRVQFAADGNCSTLINVLKKLMELPEYANEFKNFKWPWFFPKAGEYQELINQVPFNETKIWIENNDRLFKTEEEIVAWIDNPSLIPFIQAISDKVKKNFRDEVVKEMLLRTKQANETFFETFRRINVFAFK